MANYNANLDIVRELLVPSFVVTENYITGPSAKDETSTMDIVFIGDHEECRNSKMEVTDYAVFCGCDQDFDNRNAHTILTRTPYESDIMCKAKGDQGARFLRGDKTKFTYGIKPMIKLDIRAFVKYKDRLMKAPGVILGEMPQSVVHNMPLAAIMGKANKTGKVYPGHLGKLNEEYECGGDRYVLVQEGMLSEGKNRVFPTSSKRVEQKKTWFEVAPIVWQIQNFDEMPKEINPNGSGTAKHVILQTEKVIMSGIPFSLSPGKGSAVWKDSDLRLFLNGANSKISYTHPEINERISYDFEKYNFLNTCLEYNAVKQQKLEEEIDAPVYTLAEKAEEEELESKPQKKVEINNANLLKVTVSDKELSVDEQIRFYIDNGKSFMLHGPSGVGKTRRVEEADPDFVSIVLRNGMLPEEVIGKTIFPNHDTAKESLWMPPVWYTNLCQKCEAEPEKNHVLFIDEITNVKPAEQSLVFHLVLNRSIGPNIGQLPENVVVVAAGNNKQESEAAYNMPEPLFRRFEGHVYLEADVKEFITWGAGLRKDGLPKIHPLVSRFVATYSEAFYSAYDSEDPPKYALDPRGWEQVSNIIYSNKGVLSRQLLENKVGANIAANLIEFARSNFITLENVLNGDYISSDIPARYDAQLALAYSLVIVDEEHVQTVRKFIAKNLSAEILSAFDYKWVGDNEERAILLSGQKIKVFNKQAKLDEDRFNYSQIAKETREKEEEEMRSKLANSQAPTTNSTQSRPKPIVIGPIPTPAPSYMSEEEKERARLTRSLRRIREYYRMEEEAEQARRELGR